jgi:hypothetical protein
MTQTSEITTRASHPRCVMAVRILSALLAAFVLWATLRLVRAKRRRSKLPPGPPGLPFLGNVLAWPTKGRYQTFTDWKRVYGSRFSSLPRYKIDDYPGDLTYFDLAGSDVIIINSLSAATELLETKGANFSDRPPMHFLCNLVGWSDMPAFMNYGPTLVGHRRRMLQTVGSKRSVETIESTQRLATLKCLKSIHEAPHELEKHLRM